VRRAVRIVAAVLFFCAAPALADGIGPGPIRPKGAEGSPTRFLHGNAACRTASDGCRICTRTDSGMACSTAGFACVPAAWACTENEAATPR
jgi:hypothetical protein